MENELQQRQRKSCSLCIGWFQAMTAFVFLLFAVTGPMSTDAEYKNEFLWGLVPHLLSSALQFVSGIVLMYAVVKGDLGKIKTWHTLQICSLSYQFALVLFSLCASVLIPQFPSFILIGNIAIILLIIFYIWAVNIYRQYLLNVLPGNLTRLLT